jgi:hypothetical protein
VCDTLPAPVRDRAWTLRRWVSNSCFVALAIGASPSSAAPRIDFAEVCGTTAFSPTTFALF